MTDTDPVQVVRDFCAAWPDLDLDAIVAFFAEGAVYHNIPMDPMTGTDAIRTAIAGFTTGVDSVEFRLDHIAAAGPVVLTERMDIFSMPSKRIELPVMGTFEVHDRKITAWRDYFDMNMFMSQLA
jgi:limonene-1,2-epoxide hydrolase